LIWHDWSPVSTPVSPDVLCVFGDQPPAGAIARAFSSGIPIVAPVEMLPVLPAAHKDLTYTYSTDSEALALLESISGGDASPARPSRP
jgi:hypothetical protein